MKPFLILTCVSLLLLEGLLRLFDPLGLLAYWRETDNSRWQADEARGWTVPVGIQHYTRGWTASILPDGSRLVPHTNLGMCTIVLLGDSVTFGLGVNDDQTWADALARTYPAVHIVDAGVPGYNLWQVAATRQRYPGNGYLYLLIDNDAEQTEAQVIPFYERWAVIMYAQFIHKLFAPYPAPDTYFLQTLNSLKADPAVQIVGFDYGPGHLAHNVGVTLLPPYTHRLSFADPHPNVEGNQEIYQAIRPVFARLVQKVCP